MLNRVRISDFLHQIKHSAVIEPESEYSLVTVRLHHKGVVLRGKKMGSLIGSKMHRVSEGQFILSGIDARNGAFGIVPKELDGAIVTNDFWVFDIDETIIKRDYFYWLTNTPLFLNVCIKASRGETQRVRLQKTLFYNYELQIPPIEDQEDYLKRIIFIHQQLGQLNYELDTQSQYTSSLRQTIVQEAIEGKLTAMWRQEHPELLSGNNHASKLLERIKAEKEQLIKQGKIRKEKPLAPINDDEEPFKLPEGWAWCRLGDLGEWLYGKGLSKTQRKASGEFPVYGSNGIAGYHNKYLTTKRSIIVGRKGSAGALTKCDIPSWTTDVAFYIEESEFIYFDYFFIMLKSLNLENIGKGIKPGINRNEAYNLLVPLAPYDEQKAIFKRLCTLMITIDKLEKQVSERKEQSEMLMQSVLREAFATN